MKKNVFKLITDLAKVVICPINKKNTVIVLRMKQRDVRPTHVTAVGG